MRLSCLCDIDDQAEGGERGFDLFHLRGVVQVEDAGYLRQMPAQVARQPTRKLV
jgi:hypothetical protein